jgi:hypothetical protein
MSSSDPSKLRHSGSFSSGVLPPALDQIPEVSDAEVPKWAREVQYEDHFESILVHRYTIVDG